MPSIMPSHAGPAPIAARNAGSIAVAVSWLQSLNKTGEPDAQDGPIQPGLVLRFIRHGKRVYRRELSIQPENMVCVEEMLRSVSVGIVVHLSSLISWRLDTE